MAQPHRSSSMRYGRITEPVNLESQVSAKPRCQSKAALRYSWMSASGAEFLLDTRPRRAESVESPSRIPDRQQPSDDAAKDARVSRSSCSSKSRALRCSQSRSLVPTSTDCKDGSDIRSHVTTEARAIAAAQSAETEADGGEPDSASDCAGKERERSPSRMLFKTTPRPMTSSAFAPFRRRSVAPGDDLVCRVCHEKFKSPRILPCLHTFCAACIARLQTYPVNVDDPGWQASNRRKKEDCGGKQVESSERESPPLLDLSRRSPECSQESLAESAGKGDQESINGKVSSSSSETQQRVVLCPVCLKETRLSSTLIELPRNYVAERRVAREQSLAAGADQVDSRLECDSCAEFHESFLVTCRCLDCEENLCSMCELSHRRQKKTKGHRLIEVTATGHEMSTAGQLPSPPHSSAGTARLGRSRLRTAAADAQAASEMEGLSSSPCYRPVPCPRHLEADLDIFCLTCDLPGCRACARLEHRDHEWRPLSPELFRQEIQEVRRLIRDVLPRALAVDQQLQRLAETQQYVRDKATEVVGEINSCMDSYLEAVQEHRHQLVKQVESLAGEKQCALGVTERHLKQVRADLEQTCTFVSDMIENATDAEILSVKKLITDRLRSMRHTTGLCTPHLPVTWSLRFCPAEKGQVISSFQMFGRVLCRAASAANCSVSGDGLTTARVAHESTLCLHVNSEDGSQYMGKDVQVKAWLLSQNRTSRCTAVHIVIQKDSTYVLKFMPVHAGVHFLHVAVDNQPVKGSPFKFSVKAQWREHKGMWHCCTVCSTGGRGDMACACRGVSGIAQGCFHGQQSHPGGYHWSCCGKMAQQSECSSILRPNFVRQVTL